MHIPPPILYLFQPLTSLKPMDQSITIQLQMHNILQQVGSGNFLHCGSCQGMINGLCPPEVLNCCGKITSCITRDTMSWMVQQYCISNLAGFHGATFNNKYTKVVTFFDILCKSNKWGLCTETLGYHFQCNNIQLHLCRNLSLFYLFKCFAKAKICFPYLSKTTIKWLG